jgi:hypothetical protein
MYQISNIASVVGIFSSAVAMTGLAIQLRRSRLALQTQALLGLENRFYSEEMKTLRQTAARKLLAASSINCELEDILDFLHNVVMLIERRVIDRKLAIEFYKYWITRYWLAAEPYVGIVRQIDDPNTYKKLESLAREIIQKSPEINYSDEAMKVFLKKEANIEEQSPFDKQPPE